MFQFLRALISHKDAVRVRIAPSPTGYFHIGTARTALFNWLFAKKNNGKFILRIEDTDLERSDKKYEDDIIKELRWLGLEWDEGPYRQSERLDMYEKHIKKLLKQGNAYYCACSKEELEKERQSQMTRGEAPRYSGKCRSRNVSEKKAQLIRFKTGGEQLTFRDIIRGEITFDTALMGDMAIAKNTKTPLYNFAAAVDDYTMKISHVIRGEDHIANTPKQILLQRALGFPQPQYVHLPLILDPDRSKMSKRFSAVSIKEYKERGYLAEALVNFMALLGWHPAPEQSTARGKSFEKEKMPVSELIAEFDLARVQKSGAVFDTKKLDWLNSQYIKEKSGEELIGSLYELYGKDAVGERDAVLKILDVGKSRMDKLDDFKALKESFELSDYDKNLLTWKGAPAEKTLDNLKKLQEIFQPLLAHEFNRKGLEGQIMPFADSAGRASPTSGRPDRGEVLWPLRVALSGKDKSPGPFEIMEVIGKEEAMRRIEIAIKKLSN